MKNLKIISLCSLLFLVLSCSKDDDGGQDTVPPQITITEPTDHKMFEGGSLIQAQIELYDHGGLASYKVEIHAADDEHGHGVQIQQETWEYVTHGNLPLSYNHTLQLDIPIPEDVLSGEYHFVVFVLDTSGNQQVEWVEILIENQ
jgi:hypothetical protein